MTFLQRVVARLETEREARILSSRGGELYEASREVINDMRENVTHRTTERRARLAARKERIAQLRRLDYATPQVMAATGLSERQVRYAETHGD